MHMLSNHNSAKRKYSLFLCSSFLVLFVLYYVYRAGGIPDLIENGMTGSSDGPKPFLEPEDDIILNSPKPTIPTTESQSAKTERPKPTLPLEYLTVPESQQKCELFFTPSYLEHVATHQLPYCEAQSPSALQCFTAPRYVVSATAGWGATDPLCVAQGVSFNPGQKSRDFEIQCKIRDIATERASSPETAKSLDGFRDRPTDWGWYWGDTGVGASLQSWNLADQGDITGCTQQKNDGKWIMLMRRDSTDPYNIWHKLMEILQARHSLDALRIAINPATGEPWLSAEDATNVQLVFDDDREEILEPLWKTVTGNTPIRKSSLQESTCFGNVILPLPGSGSPFWSSLLDTAFPEPCLSQTLLTTYVERIFDFYGITPRKANEINKHPRITIVERKKNRKFISLDRWVAILKDRYPESPINVVDFATISIEEQIRLAQSTDILIGHHGAAMTHIVFMAAQATAVEILPRYFDQHGFRSLAGMRGVQYIAGRCLYKEEYQNGTYGTPLPEDWPPPPPQDFNHWQQQEWTYMLDDEFLGLVDAAVKSQINRIGTSYL